MRQNKNSRRNRNSYQTSNKNLKYMKTFESFGKDYELILEEEESLKSILTTIATIAALTFGSTGKATAGVKMPELKNTDVITSQIEQEGKKVELKSVTVIDNTNKTFSKKDKKFEGDPTPEIDKDGNITKSKNIVTIGGEEKSIEKTSVDSDSATFVRTIALSKEAGSTYKFNISNEFTGSITVIVRELDTQRFDYQDYTIAFTTRNKVNEDGKLIQQQHEEAGTGGHKVLDGITPFHTFDVGTETETVKGTNIQAAKGNANIAIDPGTSLGKRVLGSDGLPVMQNSADVDLVITVNVKPGTKVIVNGQEIEKGGDKNKVTSSTTTIQQHK